MKSTSRSKKNWDEILKNFKVATIGEDVDFGKTVFYLYRHINLTRGEPFYIGLGTMHPEKEAYNLRYKRAIDNRSADRNSLWVDVVKNNEYAVEILLHSNSIDYILKKEVEFISLYGRIIMGEGPLVNITRGGKGGGNFSPESGVKSVFAYDDKGNFFKRFNTQKECADYFRVTPSMISSQVNGLGVNMTLKGYILSREDFGIFFEDYEEYFRVIKKSGDSSKRRVNYFDNNMKLIRSFESCKAAAEFYGVGVDSIVSFSGNGRPDQKGNYWRKEGEVREFHEYDVMGYRKRGGPPNEPVFVYNIETGDFVASYGSIHEAARETNCPRCNISSIMRGKDNSKTVNGLTFFSENKGPNIGKVTFGKTKKVGLFEQDLLVQSFESAIDAGKAFGLTPGTIRGYCYKSTIGKPGKWRFIK